VKPSTLVDVHRVFIADSDGVQGINYQITRRHMQRGDCLYITALSTSKPFDRVLLVAFILLIARYLFPKDMAVLRNCDVTELFSRPSPIIEPRPPVVTKKADSN
jgi:hypothetical protein